MPLLRYTHLFLYTYNFEVNIVQILNTMKNDLDHFNVMRKIKSKPNSSQRNMAKELGFSLGKLNYCLNALRNKGLIKIENFKKIQIN